MSILIKSHSIARETFEVWLAADHNAEIYWSMLTVMELYN
jgi:hypothetical protein